MRYYLVYKTVINKQGFITKFVPIELFADEKLATRYVKLFNLQTPQELKEIITHNYYRMNAN